MELSYEEEAITTVVRRTGSVFFTDKNSGRLGTVGMSPAEHLPVQMGIGI